MLNGFGNGITLRPEGCSPIAEELQPIFHGISVKRRCHANQSAHDFTDGALAGNHNSSVLLAMLDPSGMERSKVRDIERHQNSSFTGRICTLRVVRLAESVDFRCTYRVNSVFSQSGGDRGVYVFVGEESQDAHSPDPSAEF